MSKCREAFKNIYPSIPSGDVYFVWQAAWNAATNNAVEICKRSKTFLEAKETIEKEKTE